MIELIKHGAVVNSRTQMKRTPLHLATLRGNLAIVKILITHGADCEALDNEKNMPCHLAAENGWVDILKWILKTRKPDLSKRNYHGMTPFELSSSVEIREAFLASGLIAKTLVESYGRTVIGRQLLMTSRADHVQKMLLRTSPLRGKAGKVGKVGKAQLLQPKKEPAMVPVKPIGKPTKSKVPANIIEYIEKVRKIVIYSKKNFQKEVRYSQPNPYSPLHRSSARKPSSSTAAWARAPSGRSTSSRSAPLGRSTQ